MKDELEREAAEDALDVFKSKGITSLDALGRGRDDGSVRLQLRGGLGAELRPNLDVLSVINNEMGRGSDFMSLERWQIHEFYTTPGYFAGTEGAELLALGLSRNSSLQSLKYVVLP